MTGLLFGVLALIGGLADEVYTGVKNGVNGVSTVPTLGITYPFEQLDDTPVAATLYSEPAYPHEPEVVVTTLLAQRELVLDPRQPLYEEKLVAKYPEKIGRIRTERFEARVSAGVVRPEYIQPTLTVSERKPAYIPPTPTIPYTRVEYTGERVRR